MMYQKKRKRNGSLRFEALEQRNLLAGDLNLATELDPIGDNGAPVVSQVEFTNADIRPESEATKQSDPAQLRGNYGRLDFGLEVINLRTNACVATLGVGWSETCKDAVKDGTLANAATVQVGDILSVLARVDDSARAYSPGVFVFAGDKIHTAYGPSVFVPVPRDFAYSSYGFVIANEIGTGKLTPVTTSVPGDMVLFSGTLDSVLADLGLTEYLQDSVTVRPLEIEIVDGGSRPLAEDDRYEFVADQEGGYGMTVPAALGVLANDTDASSDPLRAFMIASPQHGRVWLTDDGSFNYVPDLTYLGEDGFTYVAMGSVGTSSIRTVTIEGVQHPPIVQLELRAIGDDGQPISSLAVGQEFSVQLLAQGPGYRTPQDNRLSTGSLMFAPAIASPLGEVEFASERLLTDYELVHDSNGGSSLGTTVQYPTAGTSEDGVIDVDLWLLGDKLEGSEEAGFVKVPRGTYGVLQQRFVATSAGELDLSLIANVALTAHGQRASSAIAPHLLSIESPTITVYSNRIWQNPVSPLDVTNDGRISPLDALVILNRINETGSGQLPTTRPDDDQRFPDTNGDDRLSPVDVLLVINYLEDAQFSSAEGESSHLLRQHENVVDAVSEPRENAVDSNIPPLPLTDVRVSSRLIETLDSNRPIASNLVPTQLTDTNRVTSQSDYFAVSRHLASGSTSDEHDDVIELLAEDPLRAVGDAFDFATL